MFTNPSQIEQQVVWFHPQAQLAIIDQTGTITAVNSVWHSTTQQFDPAQNQSFLGTNYLTVCDTAAQNGDLDAALVADRLRAILRGELSHFEHRYPCMVQTGKQWFVMHVSRIEMASRLALLIAHEPLPEPPAVQDPPTPDLSPVQIRGIAHDLANLLMISTSSLELLREDIPTDTPYAVLLEQAHQTGRQARILVQQLLDLLRHTQAQTMLVDLERLLHENHALLKTVVSKHATLMLHSEPVPTIQGDNNQISQVLLNLVMNASDAIGPQAGQIMVNLTTRTFEAAYLAETYGQPLHPGTYAVLAVSDTGCGISAEVRQQLFQPYITTKPTGNGLGLATILAIVKQHRGAIHVSSSPGQGTTMSILFPLS
jgi:nitrogen-specific signal transduction histidine kinase